MERGGSQAGSWVTVAGRDRNGNAPPLGSGARPFPQNRSLGKVSKQMRLQNKVRSRWHGGAHLFPGPPARVNKSSWETSDRNTGAPFNEQLATEAWLSYAGTNRSRFPLHLRRRSGQFRACVPGRLAGSFFPEDHSWVLKHYLIFAFANEVSRVQLGHCIDDVPLASQARDFN